MSRFQIVGLIALVICSIASRLMAAKAFAAFSTEQKGRCLEIVMPVNLWTFVVTIILVVIWFDIIENRFPDLGGWIALPSFAAPMVVIAGLVNGARLKKNEFPIAYCRSFVIARLIFAVGLLIYAASFMIRG